MASTETLQIWNSSKKSLKGIFQVERAETDHQRRQGLMFRKKMDDQEGMLFFLHYPQQISFWMKNTFVSLDVLFMDSSQRILRIKHQARPHSLEKILSPPHILYVLELKGGVCQKKGIQEGDCVVWFQQL